MVRAWMEEHLLLSLLMLSVICVAVGFIGTYVVAGLIAIWHITEFIYLTSHLFGGA